MPYAVDIEGIHEARARLAPFAHRTPVVTCRTLDMMAGRRLYFKCENLQKVGAFKFRGACNAVMRLDDKTARRGVVTHSSGNHAQALALAARLRGIPVHVVMPANAPAVKRRATADYGAEIIECEPTQAAREAAAAEVILRTGATLVPPYAHPQVIAGQGTTALELLEENDSLQAIIAPIGGGGLMSGICVAAHALCPHLVLIGAEPEAADDAHRSLAAGRLIVHDHCETLADGLRTTLDESTTWPILRDHLEGIVTVSEEEIVATMRLVWERMKLLIEPSSAVAVAAALRRDLNCGRHVEHAGVIISGGNVDLDNLPWSNP